MHDLDAIRARRAALTTATRRVQRYPHLGLDPDTKQPIRERWTVVYEVHDPIWRETHLYIDGLAASRADATFDAAAPADIDTLLAEVDRLRAKLDERAQLYRALFDSFAYALRDIARGLDPTTGYLSSEVRTQLSAPLQQALTKQQILKAQLDALDAQAWRDQMPDDGPMWA